MLERAITQAFPPVLGFFLAFIGNAAVENPVERSIYAVIVASICGVLVKFITKLPELIAARSSAKKTRDEQLAAANDRLNSALQAAADTARLRADTAEEVRELEKASKHLLQTYYGNACNHLQYRAELLREANIAFEDFPFTEIHALMKPYDDRIRELMAAKTKVTQTLASANATQLITS